MCTVSFVSTNGKIIITSNRDEKVIRPSAIPPKNYRVNGKNIIFPKDPKAGGTWYAVNQNGSVVVLLNGADEKHVHNPPYTRSRGLVVLEIASSKNTLDGNSIFIFLLFVQKINKVALNAINDKRYMIDNINSYA